MWPGIKELEVLAKKKKKKRALDFICPVRSGRTLSPQSWGQLWLVHASQETVKTQVVSTSLAPPLRQRVAWHPVGVSPGEAYLPIHPSEGRVAVMGAWQPIDLSCFKNRVLGLALTLI